MEPVKSRRLQDGQEKETVKKTAVFQKSLRAALGLIVFTLGDYLVIQANIGLPPWDCLSIGLAQHIGFSRGQASILVSLTVLTVDLLMKEKIGIGTLLDTVICGVFLDIYTNAELLPLVHDVWAGIAFLLLGMLIMAFGQYIYMAAGLCCGPRDSFLIGTGKRLRRLPIGAVEILIMACVLAVGWLLGGAVGIGTLISAAGLGLTMQLVFHVTRFEPRDVLQIDLLTSFRMLVGQTGD